MTECKKSKFSFLSSIKLGEVGDSPLVDCSLYRHLVGSLLYLKNYRHDLAYVLGVVDRYRKNPHEIHWKEAKIILHYV